MVKDLPASSTPAASPSPEVVTAALVGATAAIIAWAAPHALLMIVIEWAAALAIVLPPALAGLWLVPNSVRAEVPLRWHLLIGAALGLGGTSLLVLLLGLAGLLHRPLWLVLLGLMALAGAFRLRGMLRKRTRRERERDDPRAVWSNPTESRGAGRFVSGSRRGSWMWVATAPFLAAALLSASLAPGMIWSEEGFGYDVLEYHLQMPREYFEAGRIVHVPHNVYASFPAGAEMIYLLAMIVQGTAVDAAITANMIHLVFAVGVVLAAAAAGRDHSPMGGAIAGVSAGSCLWLVYLSGLAYVENAMLFFGICAAGLLLRPTASKGSDGPDQGASTTGSGDPRRSGARPELLGGLLAGLALACKYTALPLIAFPLMVVAGARRAESFRVRCGRVVFFGLGVAVSFSPWFLKNLVLTGNPVFPLGNEIFRAFPAGWSEESARRWEAGHRPSEDESSVTSRAVLLWHRTLGDPLQRLSWPVVFVPMLGLTVRMRRREDWLLIAILAMQVLLWGGLTHLYARFAVVFVIPLLLLAGRSPGEGCGRTGRALLLGGLGVGLAWNAGFTWQLLRKELPRGVYGGVPPSILRTGRVPGYEPVGFANDRLPRGRRLLLVGEARAFYFDSPVDYTVVFNESPFAKAARAAPPASPGEGVLSWLRVEGYTHVLVNWSEIRRLRASAYGFPAEIHSALFDDLVAAGLRREQEFLVAGRTEPFVTIYAVPREGEPEPSVPGS